MSQSQHIFVVDDEAAARDMIGDYLKMHGFAVTLCDGGTSLRQAFERNKPDLIILDLNMPEEGGLSIIRSLKQTSRVPVIMLTATGEEGVEHPLTTSEFSLLKAFAENPKRV